MKLNYFVKVTPFLSTLLLIIFVCIGNQKEYTRLRILIWNTPSLSLSTYICISTGFGFILSYFVTNNFARFNSARTHNELKYKTG